MSSWSPAPAWADFRFHQLVEVPRSRTPAAADDEADAPDGLYAALTGAHARLTSSRHPRPAVASLWLRPERGRPLRLVLGGRPFFPPALEDGDDADFEDDEFEDGVLAGAYGKDPVHQILFPPGATARELPAREVGELVAGFRHWVECTVQPDALWARPEREGHQIGSPRRGGFDLYAAHLRSPFAWLVAAEPLHAEQVRPQLDALVKEILPLARGEVSEARRVELERKQARHRELSRLAGGGVWRIRVLVGAPTGDAAAAAAAALCSAAELEELPYLLSPDGPVEAPHADPGAERGLLGSTELLAALTRPPSRELPGVRLVDRPAFDLAPHDAAPDGLRLGRVLDRCGVAVGALRLDRESLVRHTFVCGATGSGKSHTVRHLLTEASWRGVPWLVVEPAKAEYARMAARLAPLGGEVVVLRPGDASAAPAGINPLEPARGFPLQAHADLLRALFLAAFDAQEPFPQILSAALARCYERAGWDLATGRPAEPQPAPRSGSAAGSAAGREPDPGYPTLGDLERVAETVVSEIGYGREVADNVRGFIRIRLGSLRLGTTGRFLDGGHPIDFERLMSRNAVLEIQDVGDDADKAFFMGVVLLRLTEHLRAREERERRAHERGGPPVPSGLRHLTVVEEAHRLLRRPAPGAAGPAGHAVEMFASMLAEVRAYGEGLVIAEQIPGKLVPDVVKNTAVKIVHRLPALDDRETVGATMNLDRAQSAHLVSLPAGHGAVFTAGMDRPVLVRVRDGRADESVTAPTAPISGIIGRRSETCGQDCLAEACTVRDMRAAQRLLEAEPWLTVWAELTVVAHLTGSQMPQPLPDTVRSARRAAQPRILDCALSHAVDEAVAARRAVLQPHVTASALAAHACRAMRTALAGAFDSCDADAQRYLARPHRWDEVRVALAARVTDPGRHPDTAAWEERFRRVIPGESCAQQLAAVMGWLAEEMSDRRRRDEVIFGEHPQGALVTALGRRPGTWNEQVRAGLAPFVPCDWPLYYLAAQTMRRADGEETT